MSLTASGPVARFEPLSHVYPQGTRVNERGHLEIGGCDAIELAREFGTPAYVVAEQDLRARARSFLDAVAARHEDFDVLFASKAFPARRSIACWQRRAWRVTSPPAASCSSRLRGGFDPARIYLHGNAKSERELHEALDAGVGHIVLDSLSRARAPRADRRRARRAPGGADQGHAWCRRRHAPRDLDRAGRFEVRVRRRPGARSDRAARGRAAPRAGRTALPHRLPALRARAVPRGGQGDRAARRLSGLQPRRRPRRGLHRRSTAAVDRRVRRHDRDRRARGARRRASGCCSSPVARSSPTRP